MTRRAVLFRMFLWSALAISSALTAQEPPSYLGVIKLPVELFKTDGGGLEPGQYNIEVKPVKGSYELLFSQKEQVKLSIEERPLEGDSSGPALDSPIVGTHYMRPSDEPIGTDAERQKSKTGLPPYQEESRNWKASIRVYRSADDKEAVFLFDEKLPRGQWKKIIFRLQLATSPAR